MEENVNNTVIIYKGIDPMNFGDLVTDLEETKGIFTAIFSVFNNIDLSNERVLPGYFQDQIQAKAMPKVVWSHDRKLPIGKVIEWAELPENHPGLSEKVAPYGGLRATVQMNLAKEFCREVFSDIVGGFIDQYSFGSFPTKVQKNTQLKCKDLLRGHTVELSPVVMGANPLTETESTKALDSAAEVQVYTRLDLQYALVKDSFGRQ